MNRTIQEICDEIVAGYAAGKSGMDSDMLDLLLELGDRAQEIKDLANSAQGQGGGQQ